MMVKLILNLFCHLFILVIGIFKTEVNFKDVNETYRHKNPFQLEKTTIGPQFTQEYKLPNSCNFIALRYSFN